MDYLKNMTTENGILLTFLTSSCDNNEMVIYIRLKVFYLMTLQLPRLHSIRTRCYVMLYYDTTGWKYKFYK